MCCFFVNISLGSVAIPFSDVFSSLVGGEVTKPSWEFIIQEYRLPKAIMAMMTGSGLAIAGLLMQTLFRNPLAGPFVLGISSGASLGVALFILGGTALGISSTLAFGKWGLILAAATGSFLVFLMVLGVASRVRDTMALLIIGLMVGSLTSAVVSVLSYFSKAEELQQYIFWSFGSLGDVSWQSIQILLYCFIAGLILTIASIKPLNALLLGDTYAKTLGVKHTKSRIIIIIATSILAGSITAFAGPIAFIGLAVPHLIRQMISTSNHRILIPAVLLGGAILMLICDTIAQVPTSEYTLPINAVTALVGAPVVIWLLVRKKKLLF
ncbi:iron ABC transporter [Dokdonia pacifica]|uniref:Iron complex transport system permease protein n=2 Tax=Dokdonia pacifica TaxID=1627892 RepID=A0A239D5J2_9FLAO|nr:iron ABC transporter permease [Dokdonia pacifica]GGG03693.1 iron ABC transporter [Dokdonia pacifica]SNS27121.1 iron complex transport system permease protein [Dokdonia pacifica]